MHSKGQALIEVVVFFMSLSVLLAGLCGFTLWFMTRQKLLIAAKEGALMYSSGHMTRQEVEQQMSHFLTTGVPALDPNGVEVSVGPYKGAQGSTYELDQSIAQYTRSGGWYSLLHVDPKITEKCVIKHAARYGTPFQSFYGPAVPYGG